MFSRNPVAVACWVLALALILTLCTVMWQWLPIGLFLACVAMAPQMLRRYDRSRFDTAHRRLLRDLGLPLDTPHTQPAEECLICVTRVRQGI